MTKEMFNPGYSAIRVIKIPQIDTRSKDGTPDLHQKQIIDIFKAELEHGLSSMVQTNNPDKLTVDYQWFDLKFTTKHDQICKEYLDNVSDAGFCPLFEFVEKISSHDNDEYMMSSLRLKGYFIKKSMHADYAEITLRMFGFRYSADGMLDDPEYLFKIPEGCEILSLENLYHSMRDASESYKYQFNIDATRQSWKESMLKIFNTFKEKHHGEKVIDSEGNIELVDDLELDFGPDMDYDVLRATIRGKHTW